MNINDVLSQARPSIEWTYDRKMDVFASVESTKPNGADFVEFKEIHKKVPCRISVRNLVNTEQNEPHHLNTEHKIFWSPEFAIKAGSKFIVDGVKYLTSEDPMVYVTHQEIVVRRHEWL